MIRTILVDDEDIIREGISNFIDWKSLGLELAGQAANGQEAVDLIEAAAPEIIITDVKMPRMDGIGLLALAKEKQPDCVVIMISSYDEFEYAQQALNLGAFAYLLKPIDPDRLIALLKEASERLALLHSEKKILVQARADVLESKLKVLAFGGDMDSFTAEEIQYLETFRAFSVLTVYRGTPVFREESFYEKLEQELREWMREQEKEVSIRYFQNQKRMVTYCLFHKTDGFAGVKDLQYIYAKYYRECVVGISEKQYSVQEIPRACQQSLKAVEYRFFTKESLIFYTDICVKEETVPDMPNLSASVKQVLKDGTQEKTDQFAGDLLQCILEKKLSGVVIHTLTASILMETIREIRENGGKPEDLFLSVPDMIASILDEKDPAIMVDRLCGILKDTADYIRNIRELRPNSAVYKAVRYMEEHYQDANLRLEEVANYVYINPSYFSTIFSKEMKTSFGSYLTQIRMEKAMQLLKTSQMKIYEIAEKTGYQNVSWFTVAFKKYTGKNPGEYRKLQE